MSNNRYTLDNAVSSQDSRRNARLLYITAAKYGGDWFSMPHTHAHTELFYVVGGAGQFRIAEKVFPVGTDSLIIINPGVEHTELSLDANPMEYIVLGIQGLELYSSAEGDNRYCLTSIKDGRSDVLFYLHAMLRELEAKNPGYENISQNLLEILVTFLMRQTDFSVAPAPQKVASKESAAVRQYIDTHYKESITLDQLAEIVHVSKYYMVRSFSKEYGTSPINYLITRRIEESKYLLTSTDHSLGQISRLLGFSSPSRFSQSFRKHTGINPLEYRRTSQAAQAAE